MTRSFRGTGFQPVDGGDPEQHRAGLGKPTFQVRPRPRCLYVAQPPPAVIGRRPIPSPRWGRHSCLWWARHSCLPRVRERGMYSSPRADSENCGAGFPTCTHQHKNLHHNARAFALLELMFVLGVLGFVALVAGQLFVGVTRSTTTVDQRQTAQIRVDQAVRRLRQDVWNATQITLPDPQHLQIKINDQSITWTAGQTLKREFASESQHWDDLQTTLHFDQHGPTISLAQEPTQGESGGHITLLNANSVLKGSPQ